ncbi:carbohydrate ABC transporter permease [Phytoactinopolyspora mesophila]|uniref:carbohydrate ABC transporter permease n=1 Tax=Phytoactinopolyspora mesophila TaxID=2650750 RepID=UPI003CCE1B77
MGRVGLYALATFFALWILLPMYFITIAAFSTPDDVFAYPKKLLPTNLSTETLEFFFGSSGILDALRMSVVVAALTLLIALTVGTPAGYALARFAFRGSGSFRLVVVSTRAFPIIILSIPLAVTYLRVGIDDTALGVALTHTALALPFVVLVTASVFAGISEELEEAAMTLGCTRVSAFRRVALPLALPGLAAAAIFTFIISWNEVFAASILTLQNRTLPAEMLAVLNQSPLHFRFAGGFFLMVPSLIVILVIRKYLFTMWGRVSR